MRRADRLLRNQQDAVAGQVRDKALRIFHGFAGFHVKLSAHLALHDLLERGRAIGRLPGDGAYCVQGEQRGVPRRHDHHLAVQHAGGDLGCASYIKRTHAISSQTRASGTKVRRYTGTRFTSSHADSKTRLTSSESWAKNRTFSSSERTASPSLTASIAFSGPCRRR